MQRARLIVRVESGYRMNNISIKDENIMKDLELKLLGKVSEAK
jgi:hypothetical protein